MPYTFTDYVQVMLDSAGYIGKIVKTHFILQKKAILNIYYTLSGAQGAVVAIHLVDCFKVLKAIVGMGAVGPVESAFYTRSGGSSCVEPRTLEKE